MPHQCTNCSETFADGSKEMLSGCPRCGGNTFQYLPKDSTEQPQSQEPPEPPERPGSNNTVTETVGRAATTVRDYVSQRTAEDPDPESSEPTTTPSEQSVSAEGDAGDGSTEQSRSEAGTDPSSDLTDAEVSRDPKSSEDTAQASARGELADASDLPDGPMAAGADSADEVSAEGATEESGEQPPRSDGRVVKEPDSPDRPDLETLRQELNDQFESIKILEPGQYELNLMGLYDREEHIIALQEDGKYMIEVPETWRENRPDPDDE